LRKTFYCGQISGQVFTKEK